MSLKSQLESLLFISIKPLSAKRLAELTGQEKSAVKQEIKSLMAEYNQADKGIHIQKIGLKFQMVTNSANGKLIAEFLKDETTGEQNHLKNRRY